jgi:hypothetical protein
VQVKIRGQPSELSSATTGYALPSLHYIFPNGTVPPFGERKTLVPPAGGVPITLYARNIGVMAPGTKLAVKYRGEVLETPLAASLIFLPYSSSLEVVPATADRMPVVTTTYTDTEDGIRWVAPLGCGVWACVCPCVGGGGE